MSEDNADRPKPKPDYLVDYDYRNPSPFFTKEQIELIESITADFSGADLDAVRPFERFQLNLNWMEFRPGVPLMRAASIPGLRDGPGEGTLYVRRYSPEKYTTMMDKFLDYRPADFPMEDDRKCRMRGMRFTLPNGDRYYPFAFRGDVKQWRRRLTEAARLHQTMLGEFDRGMFVLEDGQRFNSTALKADCITEPSYPKDW